MEISIWGAKYSMGYQVSQDRGRTVKPVPGIILIRFPPLSIMGSSGLTGLSVRSLRPPL